MPRTRLEMDGDTLVLVVPHDLADIVGERLLKRLTQLAKVGGGRLGAIRILG